MTSFGMLPVTLQNVICFWALVVCLGSIAGAILLWRQRRYLFCALSALCFAAGYFIMHVCREGSELRLHGCATPLTQSILQRPAILIPLVLLLDSAVIIWLRGNAILWRKTHVTSASIKESLDGLPAGVCYYLEEGRCILVNHRMNEICFALLGRSLQNGAEFFDFIKDKPIHALSDGTAVSFRHRVIDYRGVPLCELIADDVTELYEKTEKLRVENDRARQLGAGMKAYGETIADTVRRQEILQAKTVIHDEMNRMILATKKAAQNGAGEEERRGILRMWQGQALLLCKEADTKRSNNVVSDLNALASIIGIQIVWDGAPATEKAPVLTLFLSAAREAMANAAKHARAERLFIRIDESEDELRAAFTNDGERPAEPVQETGGLLNLRRMLEKADGWMKVETEGRFRLTVAIPKEERKNAV